MDINAGFNTGSKHSLIIDDFIVKCLRNWKSSINTGIKVLLRTFTKSLHFGL